MVLGKSNTAFLREVIFFGFFDVFAPKISNGATVVKNNAFERQFADKKRPIEGL